MRIKLKRVKRKGKHGIRLPSMDEIISEVVINNGLALKYCNDQSEIMVIRALDNDQRSAKHLKIMSDKIFDCLIAMEKLLVVI